MITIYYCYEILCIAQLYRKKMDQLLQTHGKLHTMSSTHKNGSVDPRCTMWYKHNQLCLQGVSSILYLSYLFNCHSRAISFCICILHLHFASYILHLASCILHICILHLAYSILHFVFIPSHIIVLKTISCGDSCK